VLLGGAMPGKVLLIIRGREPAELALVGFSSLECRFSGLIVTVTTTVTTTTRTVKVFFIIFF
jgi:hypothetical protein